MKKIKILLLNILFFLILSSCYNSSINYDTTRLKGSKAYAYNIEDEIIELVNVELIINDPKDVFDLYTLNFNYLPIGYSSMAINGLELYSYKIINDDVYYNVNEYIRLVYDFDIFYELIIKTNKLIGFNNTYIVFKNNIYENSTINP